MYLHDKKKNNNFLIRNIVLIAFKKISFVAAPCIREHKHFLKTCKYLRSIPIVWENWNRRGIPLRFAPDREEEPEVME